MFSDAEKGVAKRSGGHGTVDKYIASTTMERVFTHPGWSRIGKKKSTVVSRTTGWRERPCMLS